MNSIRQPSNVKARADEIGDMISSACDKLSGRDERTVVSSYANRLNKLEST